MRDRSVACTGRHSARLEFSAEKNPSVEIGDLHVIEPKRHYRLRAMTRTDLSGQGLRLRVHLKVFTCEQVQQAKNFALSEATRHGYWPDSLSGHYRLRSVFWDWFPHDLAFTTDIQVQLAVEAFLAEPPAPMPAVVFPAP